MGAFITTGANALDMALLDGRLSDQLSPRRVYGAGVLLLGVGNVLYGIGQFRGGSQLPSLSLVQLVMGVTLLAIGGLVLVDSDRLSAPDLSERVLFAIGIVGGLVGVYMILGGIVFLFL
jgi:MFS family permease